MLIIPTSLDTAIVMELAHPLVWLVLGFVSLACGAYCLWEMLISILLGRRPGAPRWRILGVAAFALIVAGLLSGLMPGPVTFNADGADWVSTSWGYVLAPLFMAAYIACVAVLVAWRAIDAAKTTKAGPLPNLAWWLLGLGLAIAYGALLAADEWLLDGAAVGQVSLAASIAFLTGGVGSLTAVAVIGKMRASRSV